MAAKNPCGVEFGMPLAFGIASPLAMMCTFQHQRSSVGSVLSVCWLQDCPSKPAGVMGIAENGLGGEAGRKALIASEVTTAPLSTGDAGGCELCGVEGSGMSSSFVLAAAAGFVISTVTSGDSRMTSPLTSKSLFMK
ncbi:transposase, putative [Babesia ovata]|uniref:Transposase, putative n=1 Tax=Babesia ovata TaxID=189622 RepID=A0A2H6KFW7_9APIC|nr:transposase, putative [Babesia ovata]GBE61874.1 transposase, putative [Babesia ovata]